VFHQSSADVVFVSLRESDQKVGPGGEAIELKAALKVLQ
jgi:hypothetical protein